MQWHSGEEIPTHNYNYIIATSTTVYYAYYDKGRDCFHLKADFDVYGYADPDMPNVVPEMIPRSEVKAYISLTQVYLDYTAPHTRGGDYASPRNFGETYACSPHTWG